MRALSKQTRTSIAAAILTLPLFALAMVPTAVGHEASVESAAAYSKVDHDLSPDDPSKDESGLATDLGISHDELRQQLAHQDAMDAIPFQKLDNGYAEDGSILGTNFVLWYRSSAEPTSELLEAMRAADVLQHVEFEKVPLSQDSLLQTAEALHTELRTNGSDIGVTIDTAIGGVVLYPTPATSSTDRKDAETQATDHGLAYRWAEGVPVPMARGGEFMSVGCTGGFVVETSGGNRRVASAGHCASLNDNLVYQGSTGWTVRTRTYDAFRDTLSFDKNNETYSATVRYSNTPTSRDVTALRSWAGMDVGDPVSKYGTESGYTAGTIVDKFACGGGGCDPESIFVRVTPTSSYPDMCSPGDSGGPNMWATTAYGITVAKPTKTSKDCIYMPQQLLSQAVVLKTP